MEDDSEERYSRYVGDKFFRGEQARQREEYERERTKWAKSREFGGQFRDGMCQILGRTEDQGWKTEVYFKTKYGARYHDSAKARDQRAMEFKAGEVTREALLQLKKDTVALKLGYTVEWYVVAGARIDPQVAEKMRELQERFRGQFKTVEVSREQFAQAIAIGRDLAKQREQGRERDARDKSIAKTLDARKELEAKRVELSKQLEEQARQINQARDKGRALEVDKVREAHKAMSMTLEKIREAERVQAREMLLAAGYSKEQVQALEPGLEQGRENQRQQVVLGLDVIGVTVEREDKFREAAGKAREEVDKAREAAGKARDERAQALAQLQREGMPPHIVELLGLGQAKAPSAAVELEAGQAPGVQRGGTGMSQQRDRGQSRDR